MNETWSICMCSAADLARSEAEAEMEKERSVRMASLLGFSVVRGQCTLVLEIVRA